ncbi:MAG TPA: NAD(P)H-hydrate dehydratase [Ignavibacteriaceae bacterium]|nr:NAD(P)H-hydrate dehydratase [Ignavibacteriaceae bacterium]
MIPLYSTDQIRQVDEFAIEQLGFPGIVLMENASLAIYNYFEEKILRGDRKKKIGFICGKGNNGGDGFAAARHCINNGYDIRIIYFGDEEELSKDCLTNFRIIENYSEENENISLKKFSHIKDVNWLKDCNIIIDAMLGSGAKGDLREPYKSIVGRLNKFEAMKVAIDIPTGLDADSGYGDTIFKADLTVTLGEFKKGLFFADGSANSGEIVKGGIGINNSYYENLDTNNFIIEPEDVIKIIPRKEKNVNKYSAGKVLTIAGSGKLPGAAVLTSKAVFRIGAGASILAFPKSVRKLVTKNLAEVIVETYNDDEIEYFTSESISVLKEGIKWADVLAIGPGLGREKETVEGVIKLLKSTESKLKVIDADGIFAINEKYKELNLTNSVLTPHHGEFSKLLGVNPEELKKDLLKHGKEFVKETNSYLVLKGAPTIIFLPSGEAIINSTGNPGMAKFGTGDVLTGVIAGLISQLKNIEDGVIAGVYLHSLAADLLLKKYTEFSYTASDISDNLPNAIKFLRKSFA